MVELPHLQPSGDGVVAIPHSPELLAELLDEFTSLTEQAGAPGRGALNAGLAEDVVAERLASVGLVAPEEVCVWYHWADGLAEGMKGAFPGLVPAGLERALKNYEDWVRYLDGRAGVALEDGMDPIHLDWGVPRGWLRLEHGSHGVSVECVQRDMAPRVRYASEMFYVDEPDGQGLSLCSPITYLILAIRAGGVVWDRSTERWQGNPALMPPMVSASWLG